MALYSGFAVLAVLWVLMLHPVAMLFGTLISGPAAIVFHLMMACIWAYSAWALYHLDRRGWRLLLGVMTLLSLSCIMTYWRHSFAEIAEQMGTTSGQAKALADINRRMVFWIEAGFTIPFLGYLIYIGKFFPKSLPKTLVQNP